MNQLREVEFCPKCKQIKPYYREVIGVGWIVCECAKELEKKKEAIKKKTESNEPFKFDER